MVAKVAKTNNVMRRRLRRKPTYNETAEVLNVNVSTVKLVSERSRPPISLDKAVTDRGHLTLQVLMTSFLCYMNDYTFDSLKQSSSTKLQEAINSS